MLMEICACATGAMARPASSAVVESRVLNPHIFDPLKVSAIPEIAWDAVCGREEQPSNSSYHKDFATIP